jgi:uncharacterized protein
MDNQDVIKIMVNRIVTDFAPERVILFGSRSRGDADPNSDIDLLVVLPRIKNKRQETIKMRQALADLPAAKDIFITTPQEIQERGELVGSILRPALNDGIVLYERS